VVTCPILAGQLVTVGAQELSGSQFHMLLVGEKSLRDGIDV
jgi:hypothetical protein